MGKAAKEFSFVKVREDAFDTHSHKPLEKRKERSQKEVREKLWLPHELSSSYEGIRVREREREEEDPGTR